VRLVASNPIRKGRKIQHKIHVLIWKPKNSCYTIRTLESNDQTDPPGKTKTTPTRLYQSPKCTQNNNFSFFPFSFFYILMKLAFFISSFAGMEKKPSRSQSLK